MSLFRGYTKKEREEEYFIWAIGMIIFIVGLAFIIGGENVDKNNKTNLISQTTQTACTCTNTSKHPFAPLFIGHLLSGGGFSK